MPRLRILASVFLLVLLLALTVSIAMPPAADAEDEYPCAYTGHAFVDGVPVPFDTPIRVLECSGPVLGETTTGLWGLDDNQYYLDSIMAVPGTEVNFEIWWDCDTGAEWLPADETAIHEMYGRVDVDVHAWCAPPTIHIDCAPFLFAYPGPSWDLPGALTNIGPSSPEYPDALDCVITIWGQEDIVGDPGVEWISYDAATGAGWLGTFGLEEGKPYIIVHDDCICIDWEMCH